MDTHHHKTQTFMFAHVEPPKHLLPRVLDRITLLEQRAAKMRFVLFSGTTLMSFLAMIAAFRYAWGSFAQSGFSTYASLLSSDGSVVMLYWKEFTFSLIESLPFMSITILLSAIFVLLLSLRLARGYLKHTRKTPHFAQFA
jgi:hypothetical protein